MSARVENGICDECLDRLGDLAEADELPIPWMDAGSRWSERPELTAEDVEAIRAGGVVRACVLCNRVEVER